MSQLDKYNEVFMSVFEVETGALNETFTRDKVEGWDSLAHMSLVAAIEDEFEIMFETEEILGFSSYQSGIQILKDHGIIEE